MSNRKNDIFGALFGVGLIAATIAGSYAVYKKLAARWGDTPIDGEDDAPREDKIIWIKKPADSEAEDPTVTQAFQHADLHAAVDLDGDGKPDAVLADTTGDGQVDLILADTTGDGKVDTAVLDLDGDGAFDVQVAVEPEKE